MIIVRDPQHRDAIPPWLLDEQGAPAPDLHAVSDADGDLYGLGDPLLLGSAPARAWTDLGDGYQARLVQPADTGALCRSLGWCRLTQVCDCQGRPWAVPLVLGQAAEVLLVPTYGPGFVPVWTERQQLAIDRARLARDGLAAGVDGDGQLDAQAACAWAADLLTIANHTTVALLTTLGLLDQTLVLAVLSTAAGYRPVGD